MGQTSRQTSRQAGALESICNKVDAGLQVCLSAVADTAATPTGPDTGKQELVREEKTAKTNRGKTQKHKDTRLPTVRP